MFDASALISGFNGLVGFRQNPVTGGFQLTGLTSSSSGMYFQSGHPLVSVASLVNVIPVVGDIQAEIQTIVDDALIATVWDWINYKTGLSTATNVLENDKILALGEVDLSPKTEDIFGGIRLRLADSNSLKIKLHKIGLFIETAQSVTIKIFESGISAPIYDTAHVVALGNTAQWFTLDIDLSPKKMYKIGYEIGDLTGGYYNWVDDEDYIKSHKFFNVRGFLKGVAGAATANWSDKEDIESEINTYGVNLELSAVCDYTDFILNNKQLFASAWIKKFAIEALRRFSHNPSALVNRALKSLDRDYIIFEIQGQSEENNHSLVSEYNRELEAIAVDLTKIDKVCMPCKKRSVTYRAV